MSGYATPGQTPGPWEKRPRWPWIAGAVVVALGLIGIYDRSGYDIRRLVGKTSQTTTSTPSTSTSTATTTPVTSTASGPMTGDELVWLEGIRSLHTTMDKIMTDAPPTLTEETLRELAKPLADCTPALNRLGSITDRLQPVHDLAKQACTQYANAATCFAAANDCGFDALSEGSRLFAAAEVKGEEIKGDAF